MMVDIIVKTARSITFELLNNKKVYTDRLYDVYLNDTCVLRNQHRNVCSIFDLEPDTTYDLTIVEVESGEKETLTFQTEKELVTLSVKKFGAKGDGITDDTHAIQAAILSCPKGGRVLIEKGDYLVSPLFLKSHVTIKFRKGQPYTVFVPAIIIPFYQV